MGKSQRTKGHSFERDIAIALRPIFPEALRRLEYQAQLAKGVDLDNTGRLKIQCKAYKKYAPLSKIKEIQEDGIPALVTKGDRETILICLPLSDFIEIIQNPNVIYEETCNGKDNNKNRDRVSRGRVEQETVCTKESFSEEGI